MITEMPYIEKGVNKNMIGKKKIGVLAAFLMLVSVLAIPLSVSAAVTHDVTALPSAPKWDQTVSISFVANSGVAGGWWNGTVYCNLTTPSGKTVYLGNIALVIANADANKYCNWTYKPHEAGTWTVTIDPVRTSGTFVILDHTDTFLQERSGEWLNRTVMDWAAIIWIIFIVGAFILLLLVIMGKMDKGTEKK